MLIDEIEKLVELVANANVQEVTVRTEERRVTIRKPALAPVALPPPAAPLALVVAQTALAEAPDTLEAEVYAEHYIAAPMVGIFHHAEPPVGPGMTVEAGQVVGVIESMKLMNDVRAEEGGVVREVLVEAGMAVEYGQPLFILD